MVQEYTKFWKTHIQIIVEEGRCYKRENRIGTQSVAEVGQVGSDKKTSGVGKKLESVIQTLELMHCN